MGSPPSLLHTQLAALVQRPEVLTALGAALPPFLAGAPPAAIDEGPATRSRPRSKAAREAADLPSCALPELLRSRL